MPLPVAASATVGLTGKRHAPCWAAQHRPRAERCRRPNCVSSGRGLDRRWAVAHERGATHVARLMDGEGPRAMHGLAVVPHDKIAHAPLVDVDELALRGSLRKVA